MLDRSVAAHVVEVTRPIALGEPDHVTVLERTPVGPSANELEAADDVRFAAVGDDQAGGVAIRVHRHQLHVLGSAVDARVVDAVRRGTPLHRSPTECVERHQRLRRSLDALARSRRNVDHVVHIRLYDRVTGQRIWIYVGRELVEL